MRKSGIYSITNLVTRKVYYGSSNDIDRRCRGHKSKLRSGTHPNSHLQNSWKKYGETAFVFKMEEEVPLFCLQEVEQTYLNWCKIFSYWTYNIGIDALSPTRGLKFGPPTEEHRRKIGLANSGVNSPNFGKKLSPETCRKMSLSKRGVSKPPRTELHKKKLSLALMGRVISQKTIEKSRQRFSGVNNPKYDSTIYTFHHPSLGVEKCTQFELRQKYDIESGVLSAVLKGKRKSTKGWRI